MLYRIRNPNIRKLALVKNPASGHRWHLFKEAGTDDAELDELVNQLTRDEVEALLAELGPSEEQR